MGHKRLNTGQVSVPGSGDTIHNGGNKLHDNFNEVYRAFGDRRLESKVKQGSEEWISIHPAGYFQHFPLSQYATAVSSGSMHDIDTTVAGGHFPFKLPAIGQLPGMARRGERIILQDSKGSWNLVPVRVEPAPGNNISKSNSFGHLILNESRSMCTLTVVNDELGFERWEPKIESISGESIVIDKSIVIPPTEFARVDLYNTQNYNSIKVLVYAQCQDKITSEIEKRSAYELLLMHTNTNVILTHYNVLNWNTSGTGGSTNDLDYIAVPTAVKYTNNAGASIVAIDFTTDEPPSKTVTVTVKSTNSITQR